MKTFLIKRGLTSGAATLTLGHTHTHTHTHTRTHTDSDFMRLKSTQELTDLEQLELTIFFTHHKTFYMELFSLPNWNSK